ncbi:cation:proton antiporter [Spirochaeta isovalerica]|uniref:Kef-type K+ transport system membrane component KefB/mannitol/fructose-specific phosphotransferase system IIA component (Ntr-type) n=1 Tax=Spirochaeta isovalerica TaxID=150 RepID=A0A841R4A6_9SPIO|nr:cation:proton antiporter [Spirochaeta isovalerica]MBB6478646.1 Kef-type K+ transport system membrane component KefB/mannitol/fructose-specific phosphotransferase system IIA component (Ntr-type) [Spirochaeta isovalerica]
MNKIKLIIIISSIMLISPLAAEAGESAELTHAMTSLVFQLGLIIFAARLGGKLFRKLKLPVVLGELVIGILIGPYLLGGIPLPGFAEGLFPLVADQSIPVSRELYGFSTIASIILLFIAGLETDLSLFLRYSLKGSIIGLGGIVLPFILGSSVGMFFLHKPFMDSQVLMLGLIGVATSVGISARILSEQRKMDSPEGVTILAAAVIDDVVGIILLAIVLGVISIVSDGHGGSLPWGDIALIAAKAIAVWLGFTAVGLVFARHISRFLKSFRSVTVFSILSLGLALILSGIFEQAGLAMIIGAYVMGLTLSKTDISFVIQEHLHSLHEFFVPIFFTVMGMLVNVNALLSWEVIIIGLIYSAASIGGKIIGGGIPSLFLHFNKTGALRIGLGLVPRGEVALIIAGIGLSTGYLSEEMFGVAVLMVLMTILIAPPLLEKALKRETRGTRDELADSNLTTTVFDYPSQEMTDFLITKILLEMKEEGFYIHSMEAGERIYQMRKEEIFLTMTVSENALSITSQVSEVGFVKTLVYESLLKLHETVNKLKNTSKPESLQKDLSEETEAAAFDLFKYIDSSCLTYNLKSTEKEKIINELIDILIKAGKLRDPEECRKAVFEREATMSTGMQHGIALPHGKSTGVDSLCAAVGISRKGVDFGSIDGEPSHIFILIISPKNTSGPHIQFLSSISAILNNPEARNALSRSGSRKELMANLKTYSSRK